MALDDPTAQQHLPPEERRELLRAFADRILLKVTAMDDPEDLPGVERAVRVAAVIERIYSRCDRAERQRDHTPDPRKAEAERATHEEAAIKAHVSLASTLKWGEERRQALGSWWDAAQDVTQDVTKTVTQVQPQASVQARARMPAKTPASTVVPASVKRPEIPYIDDTNGGLRTRAAPGLKNISAAAFAKPEPPPPA